MAAMGLDRAVAELLRPRGAALRGRPARVEGRPLDPVNAYGHDVLWWLDRAVRARHPLVERMTLNWHDHFATSNAEVGDSRLMLAQYRTLRRGALGRFRDLARAITGDGAMQLFLSLANSEKGAPNENYARELFELFTLGVNNGYTETDVREAARALTGFTYDYGTGRFGWDSGRHDDGVKRILGRVGRFGPLDVVDIAVEHQAHPEFICRKLWGYFSPDPCPPGDPARRWRGSTAARARTCAPCCARSSRPRCCTPAWTSRTWSSRPSSTSPGCCALTGTPIRDEQWVWRLAQMGQVPFNPPNVSGWEGGTAWLSTGSIQARFEAASAILEHKIGEGSIPRSETAAAAIDKAISATGRPRVGPDTGRALRRYARSAVAGRTEGWEVEHYYPERQRVLRHLLLAGPEAQVC